LNVDAERLSELVNPGTAELYLAAHGWEARRRTPMFSTWSRFFDQQVSHLFLPLSPDPDDYAQRLYDFVEKLASVESRDPAVILTNLRYAAADLVRVKLEGPRVGYGEVPLEEGAGLFEGTRKLMLAAACAAVEARPQYGPKKPTAATKYLDGVRLGQTEIGSYVLTVISELSTSSQETLLPHEAPAPFERRVTATLAAALKATKDAAREVISAQQGLSVFGEKVEQGVSANLCDAIALIGTDEEQLNMEVTLDWSAAWVPPPDELPAHITFDPGEQKVVEKAASYLRQLGPFEKVEVEGFVSRLERGTGEQIGTIVIEGTARGERRNVYVDLVDEPYRRAIAAHEERRRVAITGTLTKDGRHWALIDPGDLELRGGYL
jgi:hypothetical protein